MSSIFNVSTGTFPDGRAWRIQKVNGLYYLDIMQHDEYGHEYHMNVVRNIDLAPVLEARNSTHEAIERRMHING